MALRLPSLVTDDVHQRIPFVNQTHYTLVRSTPVAVSIETKLVGMDYELAQTQMAVWVFAQFAHLRAIFERTPCFLPLLLVQSDDWTFMAATQANAIVNGNIEVNGYVTTIRDKVLLVIHLPLKESGRSLQLCSTLLHGPSLNTVRGWKHALMKV